MTGLRRTLLRAALIAALLFIAVIGTVNVAARREFSIEIRQRDGRAVITAVKPGSAAESAGVRPGDVIVQINGELVGSLAQAEWRTKWAVPDQAIRITLQRDDQIFSVLLKAEERLPLGFLILDRLTGIAFLILGLLVWWPGSGDSTVSAFMRVTFVTGIAVLLYGHENVFQSALLQGFYAVTYSAVHAFVPAVLTDFVFRFTERNPKTSLLTAGRAGLYVASAAIFLLMAVMFVMIIGTDDPAWIVRFDLVHRYAYGALLIFCASISLGRLLFVYVRPASAWEKNRNRWLLICTVAGIIPYVFLEKLPTLWGQTPLVPRGVAMSFLLVIPLGWGVAVASFHMLQVEWTLSRGIVYLATAGILIYATVTLGVLGAGYMERRDALSLAVLILLGLSILGLASAAMVNRVRSVVDRLYYGDWFDYQGAIRHLAGRLAGALREKEIAGVLTEELPGILKIERASLLLLRAGQDWTIPAQPAPLESTGDLRDTLILQAGVQALPPEHAVAKAGYPVVLPLIHMEEMKGCLALGKKQSGAPYSDRDRRFLNTLSTVAGMAVANMELNDRLLEQERRAVVVELAGGIAHEIGNALSPLMGQAQLLEFTLENNSDPLPRTAVAPPLRIISEMCARIRRIVQNLSRLSQPVVLEKSAVNLNDVAEEALLLMSETAGRIKRYALETGNNPGNSPCCLRKELCSGMPCVRADKQQLSQVFINLILNAADAMEPQGKGVLTVGTGVLIDPPGVMGFVQDTGPGVPSELAEKLFLPYFTTKPQGKGTGLGLSFVRSIIEAHHGWIAVRSPVEGGARFEFFLPAELSGGQSHNQ